MFQHTIIDSELPGLSTYQANLLNGLIDTKFNQLTQYGLFTDPVALISREKQSLNKNKMYQFAESKELEYLTSPGTQITRQLDSVRLPITKLSN